MHCFWHYATVFYSTTEAHTCLLNAHTHTPPPDSSNVNDLLTSFKNQCTYALGTTAPYTTRSFSSANSCPWIKVNICNLKRETRMECRWKKSNLRVHLLHLKELLSRLNQIINNKINNIHSNFNNCFGLFWKEENGDPCQPVHWGTSRPSDGPPYYPQQGSNTPYNHQQRRRGEYNGSRQTMHIHIHT